MIFYVVLVLEHVEAGLYEEVYKFLLNFVVRPKSVKVILNELTENLQALFLSNLDRIQLHFSVLSLLSLVLFLPALYMNLLRLFKLAKVAHEPCYEVNVSFYRVLNQQNHFKFGIADLVLVLSIVGSDHVLL